MKSKSNVSWKEAQNFLTKDKYIGDLVKKWGDCPVKPIKKSLYFEDLIDAITSQQLSGKAAKTIFNRIKESVGGNLIPESILVKDDQTLRDCGLSWSKVKYVKDLAERVKEGKLKINNLDKLPDEEVIRQLTEVKGIGRWTAEMFLMFSLGRSDIFPVDDLGIKKGFEKVTGKAWNKVKSAKFAEKNWKPFRTIASWYLWRSLENR